MADKDKEEAKGAPPPPARAKPKRVRVICEGVLGSKLLKKGDVTGDPEYVKLIGHRANLVEEVK